MQFSSIDAVHMNQAIALAEQALFITSPNPRVGCVIVSADGQLLGQGHTQMAGGAHAEIMALRDAQQRGMHVKGATAYVTLEPCPMCAGAILQARVPAVVWGAADPKAGAVESLYRLFEDSRLNHRVEHIGHVLADECGRLLSDFFRGKR